MPFRRKPAAGCWRLAVPGTGEPSQGRAVLRLLVRMCVASLPFDDGALTLATATRTAPLRSALLTARLTDLAGAWWRYYCHGRRLRTGATGAEKSGCCLASGSGFRAWRVSAIAWRRAAKPLGLPFSWPGGQRISISQTHKCGPVGGDCLDIGKHWRPPARGSLGLRPSN
ncbi:hypothetical protein MKLM6_2307 [Methylomonas koyamae]|nr:hypothetical protein MKLM6_2307 [Methylomonas koyamae]